MRQQPTRRRSSRQIDMTGQRFGRWTVISRSEEINPEGKAMWLCRCDCGVVRSVIGRSLRAGLSMSCGCLNLELTRERIIRRSTTHGMTGSPEFSSWMSMLTRCHSPSSKAYPAYGGRGIWVCDLWRWSFEEFYRDMGSRPRGTSIDRIDLSGHYCPMNCRWATNQQQLDNRSITAWIEFDGRKRTVRQWAEITGLTMAAIYTRIYAGWSVEDTLTRPLRVSGNFATESP
jgi:hypothetical protein